MKSQVCVNAFVEHLDEVSYDLRGACSHNQYFGCGFQFHSLFDASVLGFIACTLADVLIVHMKLM